MLELLSKESIMSEYPLKKIIRYNHRLRIQDESVAEHTCFVSLFCLKIMSQLGLSHEQERQVMILAALHDACESVTSDIPHDVKAKYPEMKTTLDKIEEDYYRENWKRYFDDVYCSSVIAHKIIKLADAYSVFQWCTNEMSLGHKHDSIEKILEDAKMRIVNYTHEINSIIESEDEK